MAMATAPNPDARFESKPEKPDASICFVVGIANYTTIVKTEWPVLNLRVAYFGQYRKPGAGPFPSVLMMNGPF